jgi:PAS domain-containing protein
MLGRYGVQQTERENRARLVEQELRATIDRILALVVRHRRQETSDFVNRIWRNSTGLSQQSCKERWIEIICRQIEDARLTHLVGSGAWL